MRKLSAPYLFLLAATTMLFLVGCQKEDISSNSPVNPEEIASKSNNLSDQKFDYSNKVAVQWFDLELNLIKTTPGFSPPVASRALGYTGITLYESIVQGMKNFVSLKEKLGYSYALPAIETGVTYYWPAVANAALEYMETNLFVNTSQSNKAAITALYNQLHNEYLSQTGQDNLLRSEDFGRSVARVIFEWSKTDGGHQAYLNNTPFYSVPVFPGSWQPTPPAFQSTPVLAYWGNNRPFFSASVDIACLPPAPPYTFSTVSNSEFYKQAKEVYEVSLHLTQEQKNIALFWADGGGTITPPGHNMNIATQLIKELEKNLGEAAIIYAKMGMAVSDAFISCWKGKYQYNIMRPVTYIRQNIDPSWSSLIATPPFPTYCSGHATVSGASSEVLSYFFGHTNHFTDRTYERTMGARSFKSFNEAAKEAAVSRLYGGIHYRMDNEIGLEKGKLIGKNIAELKLKK